MTTIQLCFSFLASTAIVKLGVCRMWFDPPEQFDRRRDVNKMQRIQRDSEAQEESQIQRWQDLAKTLFDKDDDPEPDAA